MNDLGIADPPLVGYVAELLARFVPTESIWPMRDARGSRITQVAAMIESAESSGDDEHRRDGHRHVGDFTLFWTGVYPEALSHLKASSKTDALVDFQRQGKRSYLLASTYHGDEAEVLRRLSAEFELCAYGLSRIRKEWERTDHNPPDPGRPLLVA
jgi:hypothetical protein